MPSPTIYILILLNYRSDLNQILKNMTTRNCIWWREILGTDFQEDFCWKGVDSSMCKIDPLVWEILWLGYYAHKTGGLEYSLIHGEREGVSLNIIIRNFSVFFFFNVNNMIPKNPHCILLHRERGWKQSSSAHQYMFSKLVDGNCILLGPLQNLGCSLSRMQENWGCEPTSPPEFTLGSPVFHRNEKKIWW